jgi:hypothetical protein
MKSQMPKEEVRRLTASKRAVALFVDTASQQWIIRDAEGIFGSLSHTDNPWDERQPFSPAEETELAPVPGHYKGMLGLPL